MTVTQTELDAFHQFASARIRNQSVEIGFDELVMEWLSVRDRDEINSAIEEGLADIKEGRVRPADNAMEELRQKHGFENQI